MLKRTILSLLTAMIITLPTIPVMAAEDTSNLEDSLPEGYIPDSEKYETDADRQQKILDSQETEEITEPTTDKWGGYDTYQEYLESTKVDELTEDQAAEGYSINEYGQLVEPDEAENGEAYTEIIMGGVNPGNNTGYVTIRLSTEAEVHEEIYVHLMNLNNFRIYGCNLYEINGYETSICLPAGTYQVQEVAPTLDGAGRFYTYNRQFKVDAASTQILEVAMIDREAAIAAAEEAASTASSEETVTQPESSETTNTSMQPIAVGSSNSEETQEKKFPLLALIVMVVIVGGIIIAAKKIFPESKKHEFRGFDE